MVYFGSVESLVTCLLLCPTWADLTLQPITTDDRAVCMDGSPGKYYWKPGSSPMQNTWLVFLQPGGQCWDKVTCDARLPQYMSNIDRRESLPIGGIFAMSENGFKINKVFVPYCTSDGHMGDGAAFGYEFRGARIVRAVIQDLVEKRGLGKGSSKHYLIFGGASAGARGAMLHLDYVSEYLGDVASNVEVKGFLDSPLYLDYPAEFNPRATAFWQQSKNIYLAMNVTRLGDSCRSAYSAEPWKCLMGQYRMPHVKTKYFLVASQFDGYQLGTNGVPSEANGPQHNFAMQFAGGTRGALQNLVHGGNAVFSQACYNHAVSLSDAGFQQLTSSRRRSTMQAAFRNFLGWESEQMPDHSLSWIELCFDFECGAGCRVPGNRRLTIGLGHEEDMWAERPELPELSSEPIIP